MRPFGLQQGLWFSSRVEVARVPQSAAVSLGPLPQRQQSKNAREWARVGDSEMVSEWCGVTWAMGVVERSALHRVLSHPGTMPNDQGIHSPLIQAT